MTHGSLFSGIGGFDLAAAWAGWTNVFNCEIDPFCRRVLKYHFPESKQYEDVQTTDFSIWRDRVDVLTGGFPCQPFSVAGERKGTADDRYLWPAMLGVIRSVQPRWVVGENVYGIVSWSQGLVFEQVCTDLEAAGYEVQAYLIPAAGVGAPHLRYRTWFVAHRGDARAETVCERENKVHAAGSAPDTDGFQLSYGNSGEREERERGENAYERLEPLHSQESWEKFPTEPPICSPDDGLSAGLDGITFSAWRRESIKAYGNAIVPQVALRIFETINEYEGL